MWHPLLALPILALSSFTPPLSQNVRYTSQARSTETALASTCCEPTREGGLFCHGCSLGGGQSAADFGAWESESGANGVDYRGGPTAVRAIQHSRMVTDLIHADGTCEIRGYPDGAAAHSDFVVEFTLTAACAYRIDATVTGSSGNASVRLTGPTGLVHSLASSSGPDSLSLWSTLPAGAYMLEAHAVLTGVSPSSLGYRVNLWPGPVGTQPVDWTELKRMYSAAKP